MTDAGEDRAAVSQRAATHGARAVGAPFETTEPTLLSAPLVFSSPHSGDVYPAAFLAAARLDPLTLRRSEDAFVDALFQGVVGLGAPLLRARFPRAYLDVNREPYELDPRMFEGEMPAFANTSSLRVASGLGTVARLVAEAQEIYARRLPIADAIERVDVLYRPYHRELRRLMERASARFGRAVLVDCHSMPSTSARGARPDDLARADVVLGDRFGASCEAELVEAAESALRAMGYAVVRNKPYAGGFITEHYGAPALGWRALQIEINRAIYMNEKTLARTSNFDALAADLTRCAKALAVAAEALPDRRQAAAE